MTLDQKLHTKLEKVGKVFNLGNITRLQPDLEAIKKYYRVNKIPYSLFHTGSDLIYMGISRDGRYKKSDLLEAAITIGKYIEETKAQSVLELATGRGANSFYLAKKYPSVRFDGIDISDAQLSLARKKAGRVKNYFPTLGDYHYLSGYPDNTFDIIFQVEALCYSMTKEKVLAEICRVLKPGGLFISFDGYAKKESAHLSHDESLAKNLIEKGMALQEFENYRTFIEKVRGQHLEIVHEEDLSQYVLPTMRRFERTAAYSLIFPPLARPIARLFPKEFAYNAATAYLMPIAMQMEIFSYMLTVIQK